MSKMNSNERSSAILRKVKERRGSSLGRRESGRLSNRWRSRSLKPGKPPGLRAEARSRCEAPARRGHASLETSAVNCRSREEAPSRVALRMRKMVAWETVSLLNARSKAKVEDVSKPTRTGEGRGKARDKGANPISRPNRGARTGAAARPRTRPDTS